MNEYEEKHTARRQDDRWQYITEPELLISVVAQQGTTITADEAAAILGYMEGHDYRLMTEGCGKLSWDEVGTIISGMACEIVGVHVSCKAVPQEEGLWWIAFQNYRMPLPELCRLVQTLHPTVEDWKDALPDEGESDVGSIGMFISTTPLLGATLLMTFTAGKLYSSELMARDISVIKQVFWEDLLMKVWKQEPKERPTLKEVGDKNE